MFRVSYLVGKTSRLDGNYIYKDIINIFSDLLEVRENMKNYNSLASSEGPVYLVGTA